MREQPLPPAVLAHSEALPGQRFTGLLALLGLLLAWAALGNCGFFALSALFAGRLPASDLSPAAWEAETLQGVLDITSLLGTSCGHVFGLVDTLLASCRACPG